MPTAPHTSTVQVLGATGERFEEILSPAALEFLARLDAAFAGRRTELLAERRSTAEFLAEGGTLDFLPQTAALRADPDWRAAPPAPGLTDRRVEFTGPADLASARSAARSGAQVWTADFADATSPTWENVINGQLALVAAAGGQLSSHAQAPAGGGPTPVVRPRGWHQVEKHLTVDGRALPAALVDFGLFFFHCARQLTDAGYGPYFSLPQLAGHREARLWQDVFVFAQEQLGIPRGTVRATVPVETVTAAFEMEEILYELREHAAGLAVDRRHYLASLIKNFPERPGFVLPDRAKLTMSAPFLRAYADLVLRTCHQRGTHAVGGVADRVPSGEAAADEAALATVRLEAEHEAENGFDGCRVAHEQLVPVCRGVFDAVLAGQPHQFGRTRDDVEGSPERLLAVHRVSAAPTGEGVRADVALALRYFERWLRGHGTLHWQGRLEDGATADTARCRLWQWVRHGAVRRNTVAELVDEEAAALATEEPRALSAEARELLLRTTLDVRLPAHFSTEAYARHLVLRALLPEPQNRQVYVPHGAARSTPAPRELAGQLEEQA